MKIFVPGAMRALGMQPIPRQSACGHRLVVMTRGPAKRHTVRALGRVPVVTGAPRRRSWRRGFAEVAA
jgi:hypothetical protein